MSGSRVAIVTGGGTGIGLAVATMLAGQGIAVAIASRSSGLGRNAVRAIEEIGGHAIFVQTDVTRSAQVETLIKRTIDTFGSLDILFNNSGIAVVESEDGPTEKDWDRLFETNVKGSWLCSRAALPYLRETKGVIINNASVAGLLGVAGSIGYAASKAAVISITRSMALTYAEAGVRVNAVCPGPTATEMTYADWEAAGDRSIGQRRALALIPLARVAEPEEIAALVAYLASPQASFITGAVISIDGGKAAGIMPIDRYRW